MHSDRELETALRDLRDATGIVIPVYVPDGIDRSPWECAVRNTVAACLRETNRPEAVCVKGAGCVVQRRGHRHRHGQYPQCDTHGNGEQRRPGDHSPRPRVRSDAVRGCGSHCKGDRSRRCCCAGGAGPQGRARPRRLVQEALPARPGDRRQRLDLRRRRGTGRSRGRCGQDRPGAGLDLHDADRRRGRPRPAGRRPRSASRPAPRPRAKRARPRPGGG